MYKVFCLVCLVNNMLSKAKNKNFIAVFVILLIACSSSFFILKTKATSVTMQRMYVAVDIVEITDKLADGTYILYIGFKWERIFDNFGQEYLSDSTYEDGFTGDPDWDTYPVPIEGNKLTSYYNDLSSSHSYAKDISESGYQIIMYLKLTKLGTTETESVTLGGSSEDDYDTQYVTDGIWFGTFGGELEITYYIYDV